MQDNHFYNLALQLTEESKSLWRIKNHYKQDAAGCDACTTFWEKMEQDKEEHIREITELMKNHL